MGLPLNLWVRPRSFSSSSVCMDRGRERRRRTKDEYGFLLVLGKAPCRNCAFPTVSALLRRDYEGATHGYTRSGKLFVVSSEYNGEERMLDQSLYAVNYPPILRKSHKKSALAKRDAF